MKTLIITGTARTIQQPPGELGAISYKVEYKVNIWGQSPARPEVQLITWIEQTLNGYDELQEVCRDKYAKYFQTSLSDIISMEHLILLPC